jgi:hypothetical protein
MGAYDDYIELLCSGVVEYDCGEDEPCTGIAFFPCGTRFETKIAGSTDFQLPFRYQVWRERAALEPCCYWRDEDSEPSNLERLEYNNVSPDDPVIFQFANVTTSTGTFTTTVFDEVTQSTLEVDNAELEVVGGWSHEDVPSFVLEPRTLKPILTSSGIGSIPTRCTLDAASTWNQGTDATPPCNGAKTQCPYYTGKTFKYLEDEFMAPGQIIQGEVVQELRSLIRDWKNLPDPNEAWLDAFELPYIWSRDFDDFPLLINSDPPLNVEQLDKITRLTRVFWNSSVDDAELTRVPSDPGGTPLNAGTPSFPTAVDNLGVAVGPSIEVTFPPPRFAEGSLLASSPFPFSTFHGTEHRMYMSGRSIGSISVIVINRTLLPEFPDLDGAEIDEDLDEDLTAILDDLVIRSFTYGELPGLQTTAAGSDRFWEIRDGIHLDPNTVNDIYVLGKIGGVWGYVNFEVDYKFYHADLIQEGYSSILPLPQTLGLNVRNASQTADSVRFRVQNFGAPDLTVSRIYHAASLDRSASRLVSNKDSDELPDKRYWGISEEYVEDLSGDSLDSGQLRWTKLDNCNRYLIEVKSPALSAACPAGIDRSWEPDRIWFTITDEEGGTQEEIEMSPVEDPEFSRDLSGSIMQVNYIIVEPKDPVNVRQPTAQSLVNMTLRKFTGFSGDQFSIESDQFDALVNEFSSQEFNLRKIGDVPVSPAVSGMEFSSAGHSFSVAQGGRSFFVGDVAKTEMSYMVEFSDTQGEVVGKKWVVGVAEIVNFWVRDIDILYAWGANQDYELLRPDYARAITDLITGETYSASMLDIPPTLEENTRTVYYPRCRDHEGLSGEFGPMFVPYDSCPEVPAVRINDLGIYVLFRIPDTSPIDEKYRGPLAQTVKTARHNVLGTLTKCVWEFSIGTFTRATAEWNGYARIRGPITDNFNPFLSTLYRIQGWTRPQLGNRGREALRVFRSPYYREYVFIGENSKPQVGLGWLPGHPYSIGPTSVYDDQAPRIMFDNQIERYGDIVAADYDSYLGQISLLNRARDRAEGEDKVPLITTDLTKETGSFVRVGWESIYEIRKIRDLTGNGTQFPSKGFYHNFCQQSIVWAWPEAEIELAREPIQGSVDIFSTPAITGIYFRKPRTDAWPSRIVDKWERPVFIHVPEDQYTVTVRDIEYDTATGEILEHPRIELNPDFPVYFDRFTGEILDAPNDTTRASEIQPYALVEQGGAISGLEFPLEPFYPVTELENDFPTEADELEDFIREGNLYEVGVIKVYAEDDLEGPLSTENSYTGFIPSLDVIDVVPFVLPKQKECLNVNGKFSDKMAPTVNYSTYPAPLDSIVLRSIKSDQDLSTETENILDCATTPVPDTDKTWYFLFLSDEPLDPSLQKGYVGPITITIDLIQPLELYSIQFAYEIFGRSTIDPSVQEDQPPEQDPSFKMSFINTDDNSTVEFVDKPTIDLRPAANRVSTHTLTRAFEFTAEDGEFKPFKGNRVKLEFGPRGVNTGLRISEIRLEYLSIRQVTESLVVLEPRYIPSLGYSQSIEDGQPDLESVGSQDGRYLTGAVSQIDMADAQESSGIAEYWRPGAVSLDDEVLTRGKLRRHWAGVFDSFDVARFFRDSNPTDPSLFFLDDSVTDSEARQGELIQDTVEFLEELDTMLDVGLQTFYSPRDLFLLESLGSEGSVPASTSEYVVDVPENLINLNGLVSVPEKSPGWQDPGFYACLTDQGFSIVGCVQGLVTILGVRHPHVAYRQQTQEVCRGGTQDGIDQYDLLDLPGFLDGPGFLGAGSSAAGAVESSDKLNQIGDLSRALEEPLAVIARNKRRYQP